MSVQGKWDLTVLAPTGTVNSTLDVTVHGNVVTGTTKRSDGLTANIMDGVFDGETLAFDIEIQDPISAVLHFELTVSGDTLTGIVTSEQIDEAKVTGKRI